MIHITLIPRVNGCLPFQWFLYKIENIVNTSRALSSLGNLSAVPPSLVLTAKRQGFSDSQIASLLNTTEGQVRYFRKSQDPQIIPFVKRIDTLAAEYPAHTNYLYTTYNASAHDVTFGDHGTMVLGSGVYRIGSSVEFDWCAVTCARKLREMGDTVNEDGKTVGGKTIMVNYNPETVSTDFDEADRLYFEELGWERVMDIYELEGAKGVIVSVGGQLSLLCRRDGISTSCPLHRSAPAKHCASAQGERSQRSRHGSLTDRQRRGSSQVLECAGFYWCRPTRVG